MTKIDFVEASTGSLGHGFPTMHWNSFGFKNKKFKE